MTTSHQERRRNADTDAYFNAQFDAKPEVVLPGQVGFASGAENMLVASVGCGAVVSLFDTDLKMGALAYVSLAPDVLKVFPYFKDAKDSMLKTAFEPLDEALKVMKNNGAGKNRLQLRVMGGAELTDETPDAGTKNSVFVSEYISRQGLSLMNKDVGGGFIRRVHFFPDTGRAVRILLKRQSDYEYVEAIEADYHNKST